MSEPPSAMYLKNLTFKSEIPQCPQCLYPLVSIDYEIYTNTKVVLGEPVETAKKLLIQAMEYLSR